MWYELAVFCISDVRDLGRGGSKGQGRHSMCRDGEKHLLKGQRTGVLKDARKTANLLVSL